MNSNHGIVKNVCVPDFSVLISTRKHKRFHLCCEIWNNRIARQRVVSLAEMIRGFDGFLFRADFPMMQLFLLAFLCCGSPGPAASGTILPKQFLPRLHFKQKIDDTKVVFFSVTTL